MEHTVIGRVLNINDDIIGITCEVLIYYCVYYYDGNLSGNMTEAKSYRNTNHWLSTVLIIGFKKQNTLMIFLDALWKREYIYYIKWGFPW